MSQAILLHPDDNVLVLSASVASGQTVLLDGVAVTLSQDIPAGHKIARRALVAGEKVFKYGAPIGSMRASAAVGDHVHLHNMKSDYIASHTREAVGEGQ